MLFIALFLGACGHPQAPTWSAASGKADLLKHADSIVAVYQPGETIQSVNCDNEMSQAGLMLYCLISTSSGYPNGYIGLVSDTHDGGMTLDWNVTCTTDQCRIPDSVE